LHPDSRRKPESTAPSLHGFLISLLGGSKTQIGGQLASFVVVIAGIIATHGVEGLFLCTMMAA